MKDHEHIFRAYDVRGVYGKDLTDEVAETIGKAFGTFLGGKGKILLGRDARSSGPALEEAFSRGLMSTGVYVESLGIVPIPVLNFTVLQEKPTAGVMLTASHNPKEYNGIRFRHPDGTGYTKGNVKVKEVYAKGEFLEGKGKQTTRDPHKVVQVYLDYLLSKIKLDKPLKIVIDASNGAGSVCAPYLFAQAGCQVTTLNCQPDGSFPGGSPDPQKHLDDLKAMVLHKKADLGVAYDGDADRALLIGEDGNFIKAEKAGVVIARDFFDLSKKVIANVSCSMIVEEALKDEAEVIRTRVGDVFIAEEIKKHGACLGVEISSHYFLPGFFPFDDGILASLKFAQIVSRDAKASELVKNMPNYPAKKIEIECLDNIKFKSVDSLASELKGEGLEVNDIDGVRVDFEDGWMMFRASNTEPIIRLMAEAHTQERVDELIEKYKQRILKAISK